MKFSTTLAIGSIILVMLASPVVAQDEKAAEKADKFDAKQIQGSWELDKGMKAGSDSVGEALGKTFIDDKQFRLPTPDGEFIMEYELDASESPAHIDMTITAGSAEGSVAKGIVDIKDGKLMLCYHPMGGARPTEFSSSEDNGNHMFVMSRMKLKADDLLGKWQYTSGQRAGAKVEKARLAGNVTVDKENFNVPGGGEEGFVMSYSLNSDTSPAQIDLEMKSGAGPVGSKAVGIIKVEDGVMSFCYDNTGMNRPESFDSSEDNGFFMFTLKKVEEQTKKEVEKKKDDK